MNENETISLQTDDGAIDCHLVVDIDLDEKQYCLLSPAHPLVGVVRDDEDGIEEILPADAGPITEALSQALSARGLSLSVVGGAFRLGGELTDEVLELCDALTVGDEEDDEETEIILADAELDGKKYILLVPENPPLFPAKLQADGTAKLLDDEELERVESQLADAFEEVAAAE